MPHSSDDRLPTAPHGSGFQLDPLGVSGGQRIAEADDQLLLFVQEPDFPVPLQETFNKGIGPSGASGSAIYPDRHLGAGFLARPLGRAVHRLAQQETT